MRPRMLPVCCGRQLIVPQQLQSLHFGQFSTWCMKTVGWRSLTLSTPAHTSGSRFASFDRDRHLLTTKKQASNILVSQWLVS